MSRSANARPRIVVTGQIPTPATELLESVGETWVSPVDRPLTTQEIHEAVADSDGIVSLVHDRIDDDVLRAAGPRLRVVANVAVGHDNIDLAACASRGVIVTNTPGVVSEATADLAFALILMVTRRLGEAERMIRAGGPWAWSMTFLLGSSIQGKTLGVVGLGQIGTAVARRARVFGMEIAYTGRRRADSSLEAELDAQFLPLPELLSEADVVTLHCPLTPSTHHLIDAVALERMKPTAFLINTTRGPVVDEAALAQALSEGVIAGAGLDVYEHEPTIYPDLLELDNVVLIPHLGTATTETRTDMAVIAARNVLAVLADTRPLTPIEQ